MTGNLTFSDEPIDPTDPAQDRLDHGPFAQRIAEVLEHLQLENSSSVLALIGAWGAGKTSTLRGIAGQLEGRDSGWLTASFNPWLFSDEESLLLGFLKTLQEAMPKDRRWKRARAYVGRFGQSISPLGKLTGLVGVDSSGLLEAFGRRLAEGPSAAKAQAALTEELKTLQRPILLIFDDLDRLAPSELLQTLKLVRLVGRLPHVYYLLAYDEETLLETLSRTELVGDERGRALDYLEKVVQVRLDMPPLRDHQVSELFNEGFFSDLLARAPSVVLDETDAARLGQAYWGILIHTLRTPRSIKRLFAQADVVVGLAAEGEANLVDLFLINYIRTHEPSLYRALPGLRQDLLRTPQGLFAKRPEASELAEQWHQALRDRHVRTENVEGTLKLLRVLFPSLDARLTGSSLPRADYDAIASRRGVGHEDYFDRYFAHSVPREDLPDAVVIDAFVAAERGVPSRSIDQVRDVLATEPGRVLRKLESQLTLSNDSALQSLRWVGSAYAQMPTDRGLFDYRGRREAEAFVETVLSQVDESRGLEMLDVLCSTDSGCQLGVTVCASIKRDGHEPSVHWREEAVEFVAAKAAVMMNTYVDKPIGALGERPMSFLWMWWHVAPDTATDWVRSQLLNDRWELLDFIAANVPIAIGSTGEVISDFNVEDLGRWVPLDFALERLRAELDPLPEDVKDFNRWQAKPTRENLRLAALNAMATLAERRKSEIGTNSPETDPQ